MPPLEAEVSPHENSDSLYRIFGWMLEQMGGSIALSPIEQTRVFHTNALKRIEALKDDRGNLIIRVVSE
jgi:hypothetical protein